MIVCCFPEHKALNMKKLNLKITLLALLAFIGGVRMNSQAQFGLAIGPKAGVSISSFNGDGIENIDERISWLGGAFVNIQIGPHLALQPEILFSRKGAEFVSNNVRNSIAINYFEIPILGKLRLPINDVIFPHVLVGPNFAFRTNVDYSSYDLDNGTAITTNDTDIRKSDVGALVGAGIDIQTRDSGLFFTVDGRYGFGFNKITRVDNDVQIRNAGWSFSVGVGFLLMHR